MEIEAETRQRPSLDAEEVSHFEWLASEWWDEKGRFRSLHAFNPARLKFILDEISRWRAPGQGGFRPLDGLSVLDVGCGGGILCEPLARLGACVTGIDPVSESIKIATTHAARQGLPISYRAAAVEDLARESLFYDVVIASEVIEHVADANSFIQSCRRLCKPRALLFISTFNRTAKSFGLGIVAAEYILGLIPRGTHDWRKFIKPEELKIILRKSGFEPARLCGIVFDPLAGEWRLSPKDMGVNYILSAEAVSS